MFILEIDFHDGISEKETILVRRPYAIIGASDLAHVVIEGASSSLPEISITRGIGNEFRCQLLPSVDGKKSEVATFLEGMYRGEASLNLGNVTAHITSLDGDFIIDADEPTDLAGIRVLRSSLAHPSPLLPAVVVLSRSPYFYSFPSSGEVLVGRSRACHLRLDMEGIENEHLRLEYKDNQIIVEDLGAKEGTFIDGEKLVGRKLIKSSSDIGIGKNANICVVTHRNELPGLKNRIQKSLVRVARTSLYPCIISASPDVKPQRFVIEQRSSISIGRDPSSDIWIQASHISNNHTIIHIDSDHSVSVTDHSTNGTFFNNTRLQKGIKTKVWGEPPVINLQSNLELGVCFSEEEERKMLGGSVLSAVAINKDLSKKENNSNKNESKREKSKTGVILNDGHSFSKIKNQESNVVAEPSIGQDSVNAGKDQNQNNQKIKFENKDSGYSQKGGFGLKNRGFGNETGSRVRQVSLNQSQGSIDNKFNSIFNRLPVDIKDFLSQYDKMVLLGAMGIVIILFIMFVFAFIS